MHRWRIGVAVLILSAAIGVSSASAQNAQITGVVKDEQGAVLPGATVTLRNVETGFERSVVTESDGRYRIQALQPAVPVRPDSANTNLAGGYCR